ncbi:glycoside hydrolase [Nonomuraea sp. NPDC000554]|uniref:glycoside hydrolase n=1 Tax=Nonomuraea sp. NPDC000554 TaxID=3154259 RepID=UPI0033169957
MNMTKLVGTALAGVMAVGCGTAPQAATASEGPMRLAGDTLIVPLAGGEAKVEPASLKVTATTDDGQELLLSSAVDGLGSASRPRIARGEASWEIPERGLSVGVRPRDGRLVVDVRSRTGTLAWPVTGADPATTSLQLPSGEGLSLPVADPWWNARTTDLGSGLLMPFWGATIGRHGAAYITPTDIGTNLAVASAGGRLQATASHDFATAPSYTVEVALTGDSPVAQAADYRRWVISHGGLTTLKEKIRANPEVAKLAGAVHAYLWGDARSPRSIRRLHELGIDRMWLGYDADGKGMSRQAVQAAKKAGYLVGPYDSWANAQDPKTADTSVSKWPGRLWPDGCVHDADGRPKDGFGGRGCYLSSQALPREVIAERVDTMAANGANSYFLDVDAAGELFDDHTPSHRMTQEQDRANRIARMRYLSSDRKLVLGSEAAAGWANQVLAFSHGSTTPSLQFLWPLRRDKQNWGGYWPQDAPGLFFKPVELPAEAAKAMYDPRYRVPLYGTVLHDAVVNLDRWDLDYYKITNVKRTKALMSMLYGTPLNFVLSGSTLEQRGPEIARLQQAFSRVHRDTMTRPMTGFAWLSSDRLVQRTTFGDLTVTANFGERPYHGLAPGCVTAARNAMRPETWCAAR